MSHPEIQDAEIPVIDISSASLEVADEVLHAASTHGFLFIKNDGVTIPPEDIDEMFRLVSIHQI
jgi:ubiquinone/menaquinone biosynthesis C-methylase UbiE